MKKRVGSMLLVLVLFIALLPATVRAGECNNDLIYEIIDDHVVITEYTGNAAELTIPAEIDGLPVTGIGRHAFFTDTLKRICIPASIAVIGENAFRDCSSLLEIRVDADNPYFSSDGTGVLFDKAKSTLLRVPAARSGSYTVPDGVETIDIHAFAYCNTMTRIDIPASVTEIGMNTNTGTHAFEFCLSLSGISVNQNNPIYSSDDQGVLFDKEQTVLLRAPRAIPSAYLIPEGVDTIGMAAFRYCENLTDFSIPNGVTTVEDYAFNGCLKLKTVSIPESITYIGENAFSFCINLTGFNVDDNNLSYSNDERGVLFDKTKLILHQAPTMIANSYTIPDSVVAIMDRAFMLCKELTSISIPEGAISIGEEAFRGCSSLTTITIPGTIDYLGTNAFDLCEALTTIYCIGDAPMLGESDFFEIPIPLTVYYPGYDPTWTEEVRQHFLGEITWIPYNPDNPFVDVPFGSFYEAPVMWALENGITAGTSPTTFTPNGSCLRAQVVTFLHRAAGNPEPSSIINPFSDVITADYFYNPVLWAVEKGITQGTSATTFGSYDVCNRAAVVTFLWRAAGEPEPSSTSNPFVDVTDTDYFYKPVLWAVENGITSGVDATHFAPTSPCNRAQVVTFLYRAYN